MRRAPALGVAFLLAAAGCGKPVLRVADASLGDYYTEREFKKLSKEQREEYCRELAEQRRSYEAQIADANEAIQAMRARADSRGGEGDSLRAVADSLEGRVAGLRDGGGPGAVGSVPRYTVRRGESLWRISKRTTVYGDGRSWPRLYQANRDLIRDPDLIHPGQEIRIPR